MSSLVLASSSPRRRELLAGLGLDFSVRVAAVDETPHPNEAPRNYVERCAAAKALAASAAGAARAVDHQENAEIVLAADTIVEVDGAILGKPVSRTDAERMLRLLSGRKHHVLSAVAVAVAGKGTFTEVETTTVQVAHLDDHEIEWYLETGEAIDKAGAYAIQGLFGLFVERIIGNHSNVVGLPLPVVYRLLKRAGLSLLDIVSSESLD